MVTHSSLVMAAYNGEWDGTRNTIPIAKMCVVPVYNIFGFLLDIWFEGVSAAKDYWGFKLPVLY